MHWMKQQQSYLEFKEMDYKMAPEPFHIGKGPFLETSIKEPVLWKYIIPFYIFRTNQEFSRSRLANYFGPRSGAKYFEENNEYLIEIPLFSLNDEELGFLRLSTKGRN